MAKEPMDAEPSAVADPAALHAELDALSAELAAARHDHAAALEREAALRSELQHRVRNMLALIRSIFSRSVATSETLAVLADHFSGRLDVLSRYQFSGTFASGRSVDFEGMVRDELLNFHADEDARVLVSGPEVRLGHDAVQAVALLLHELATNSIKFGTLSSEDARARLDVRWRVADGRLHIRWEEAGVPILGADARRVGFGRQFIEQALPYQLGAETRFEFKPGGVRCLVILPPQAFEPPRVAD